MAIEVRHLTKRFARPDGTELTAVDRLSFRVEAGEVYGLLGPNGAGKTTTIRMLLGLLTPTGGSAEIDGVSTLHSPATVKARIGLVTAGLGVYRSLSVREMLLFFADLYGVPPRTADERLAELSDRLRMGPLMEQGCGTLSTGQRQRLNFARALIHDPPVLLFDEPTTGMDVLSSRVVGEFVSRLRDEGKVVILSTHRLDEAERLCDRFGLLHEGRLVDEGTLEELTGRTGCEGLVSIFLALTDRVATPAAAGGEDE